jgi:tRNA modification GTPase
MTTLDDTIAAPASAPGRGLRAVVRVAGPATNAVVTARFTPDDKGLWRDCRLAARHSGQLQLPGFSSPVAADVQFWPTNRSYTGQPSAEIHLVGSPPLVDALLEALYSAGARPARPGEFTLRAFLSGRIDLVQAEAVLGVIDADDTAQLRQALAQLAGGISSRIADCREQLLLHLADLEAGLDFVEEDIEFVSREALRQRLDDALAMLSDLLHQADRRMHVTGRRAVVLAGLPNAGKSTLFNALAGDDAAIVSSRRGTTRDVLTRSMEWHGVSLDLFDTAGWEGACESVMSRAGEQRGDRLGRADLVLWCRDANLAAEETEEDAAAFESVRSSSRPCLSVVTKADLRNRLMPEPDGLRVSAVTGEGLDLLRRVVAAKLRDAEETRGELISATAARCRDSLRCAADALSRAREAAETGEGDELIAVELRAGLDELGQICGAVYTDDILDRIFSRFCIGK